MSTLHAYLVGTLGVVLLGAAWVAVQRAWSRAFPGVFDDPDVLAERRGCHGCDIPCELEESR